MKSNNVKKYIIPFALAISVSACSVPFTGQITEQKLETGMLKEGKGTLLINLGQIFQSGFSLKKFSFSDSEVRKVKITVFSVDENGNRLPDVEKEFERDSFYRTISLSVAAGKNKVITIETLDEEDVVLSTLAASFSVTAGISKTLRINYGTYPAAMVLKSLIETSPANASLVDLKKLEDLMNAITGYDVETNSYEGVNPAYVQISSIVQAIINANGVVPVYSRGQFDQEVKGTLRVTVRDLNGNIVKNVKLTLNDMTATNINSTEDDTSVIKEVSQGQWLLRANGYANSVYGYAERVINIDPGNLDQNINLVLSEATVTGIEFEDIRDNVPVPANIELSVGSSVTLKAKVTMSDRSVTENIVWSTNNSSIAGVNGGTIYGSANGTTTIRATSGKDNTKFVQVNVTVSARNSDGPIINSFSPSASAIGTEVIIYGSNFDNSAKNANTVNFNGLPVQEYLEATKTELRVKIPVGATTGKVTVTNNKGTYISSDYFIINNPANTDGMVFIPGGEFDMGYSGDEDDDFYPSHKVKIAPFHIDRTEVTNSQYQQFVDDCQPYERNPNGTVKNTSCTLPDNSVVEIWKGAGLAFINGDQSITSPAYWNDTRFNRSEQPVVGISWYEAEAYANYKKRKLPTEAQWEFAAKGEDNYIYPWGSYDPLNRANGFRGNLGADDGFQFTAPVSSFNKDGDSPFGLKDMSGNAYEWVNDWYNAGYYKNGPVENPQGPNIGGTKVLRGGSWLNHPYFENDTTKLLDSLKTYHRFYSSPANRSNYVGFRTAK